MVPPSLRLVIDWVHIREAERLGRAISPFGLALVEQSRYCAGQVAEDGIRLIDGATGAEARYAPNPDLLEYQRRFARGEQVLPAMFTLQLQID